MTQPDPASHLPSAAGSPFKTKNFNKFFFGIMIAALVLAACILAYFLLLGRHHAPRTAPVSSLRGRPATLTAMSRHQPL